MNKHKHYEKAYEAYTALSYNPERRAESECKYFDEVIAELKEIGADEKALIKFESLFVNALRATGRCMSSMITGPANFPVAKMIKASERERKALDEMMDFVEKVKKAIHKKNNPEKYPIKSDDKNAIDKLKAKLEILEKNQIKMKACNKIVRDKKEDKRIRLLEILDNEEAIIVLLTPNCFGNIGFESFQLTNNNAKIKNTKKRIIQLEKESLRVTREIFIEGIKVIENAEDNRIEFHFNGKPKQEIINLMKRHGFKWSPSKGCWQRLWNNNCVFSIKHLIKPELKKLN